MLFQAESEVCGSVIQDEAKNEDIRSGVVDEVEIMGNRSVHM